MVIMQLGEHNSRNCTRHARILPRYCTVILLKYNMYRTEIAGNMLMGKGVCDDRTSLTGAGGIYSIGAVARMLGLSQGAIRSWEDRYRCVVAERNEGGRRVYTREQLEELRFIKERLDEGLSAADAHRLLAERQAGGEPILQRQAPHPGTQMMPSARGSPPSGRAVGSNG